jgi:hypothetical protein
MSSPTLNQSVFAVDTVTPAIPKAQPEIAAEGGADAALTARAVVTVSLMGAAIWYLVWKMALYFLAGH